jgi:PKD repeat protein
LPNDPPVADPNGPYTDNEGSPVTFDGSGSSDPDGDLLTFDWTFGDGNIGTGETFVHTYADNGEYEVCLTVTDPDGLADTQCTTATIANVAPTVEAITPDLALVEVGTPINATADFTDPGTEDTHTAEWNWNWPDGIPVAGSVTQGTGSGSVADPHTYTTPGVYTIELTVSDDDGGAGTSVFQYVVVYDPAGGFVTGGGWIDSPEGAYVADPQLTGKANFGFVSKYKKGATIPTGNTEFQFKAGDLNFHSDTYEWLVVNQAGTNAQFKGSGTINGEGDYKFMLWAGDDDPDTFRIKIWEEDDLGNETVVYDNGFDQEIGGGSIKVHTK